MNSTGSNVDVIGGSCTVASGAGAGLVDKEGNPEVVTVPGVGTYTIQEMRAALSSYSGRTAAE